MSSTPTKTLPEGWYWVSGRKGFSSPEYARHDADLYTPHGCHAGQIRHSMFFAGEVRFTTFTWSEDCCGGENSSHDSFEGAKAFVEAAIVRQGFHMECEFNCSDDGDVEEAAEIASLGWDSLSGDAQDLVQDIVEAMLGPKRFRAWCEEGKGE